MDKREKWVVDACVVIALLRHDVEADRAHAVYDLLASRKDGHLRLIMPALQCAEVISVHQRKENLTHDERRADVAHLAELVDDLAFEYIDVTSIDVKRAWTLWGEYQVKYQDGLMVAAAERIGASIYTYDRSLMARLEGYQGVRLEEPPVDDSCLFHTLDVDKGEVS